MKKLFLLFAFFGLICLTTNAQAPTKEVKVEKKVCTATASTPAAKAAALDKSIESKTCAVSGKVSYVRKSVCAVSGKVSYADVIYSPAAGKFVNVSPKGMKKAACAKKAACVKKGASASKVSLSDGKKACTPAEKAACAKMGKVCVKSAACKGAKSAKASTESSDVKAVKVNNKE